MSDWEATPGSSDELTGEEVGDYQVYDWDKAWTAHMCCWEHNRKWSTSYVHLRRWVGIPLMGFPRWLWFRSLGFMDRSGLRG